MGKPRLLITVGDSLTEGVGCYDLELIKTHNITQQENHFNYNNPYNKKFEEFYDKSMEGFHELGWPNNLGKKLNYDKVINIGASGSSSSAHLKLFVEKILPKNLSQYDVLVIWMLTDPRRISFYSDGKIRGFHVGTNLHNEYINSSSGIIFDSNLETIFYIKCMEEICENNNFDLLITSFGRQSFNEIRSIYDSKYYMKEINGELTFICSLNSNQISSLCPHPNQFGYDYFSKNMFESIQKYNTNLINKNKVNKFEWEWDGIPINHYRNNYSYLIPPKPFI
tara:strand:- start:175 stop:1017 length:843 start_codon:yes stop_codon:yes gene_type:complete